VPARSALSILDLTLDNGLTTHAQQQADYFATVDSGDLQEVYWTGPNGEGENVAIVKAGKKEPMSYASKK